MNSIKNLIKALMAASLILAFGCEKNMKNTQVGDKRVLAKINNYEMTIADFKDGVKLAAGYKNFALDSIKAKQELLDDLIIKNTLIQEAQKLDFDKDASFIKEIQRYWEQALLKLLFKKKYEELFQTIKVTDVEISQEYDKMKREYTAKLEALEEMYNQISEKLLERKTREAFEVWANSVKNRAKIKINQSLLGEITLN